MAPENQEHNAARRTKLRFVMSARKKRVAKELRPLFSPETVFSMFKRRLEAFLRSRNAWSQRREMRLKVLTHNVMILLRIEVFYTAVLTPFPPLDGSTCGAAGRF
jgi:hypothetical protein